MFSPTELEAMTAVVNETIQSGLGTEVTIYRGDTMLAPQAVRLVRPGGMGRNVTGDGVESAQQTVEVVGRPGMNIRARDRFNVDGVAYEVIAVQPQRQIKTVATARAIQ